MSGIKERLIQVVLRGKDMLSGEANKSAAALDELRVTGEQLQAALGQTEGAAKLARQLDQTRTTVERATTAYSKAQDDVARLRRELDVAPSSKGLQTSLKEVERYARSAGRELDRLRDAERDLEKQAIAAGIATDDLGTEQDRLQREVDEARLAVGENAEALDDLRRKQAAAAAGAAQHASRVDATREAMSGGMRTVIGYAAAYVSLETAIGLASRATGAIRDGIVAMLRTGDEFEGMESRLTSLMGSIEAGQQATAWIKEFAKTTPLSLEEVINSFALLRSYGLDPMDGTLQKLVDKSEQLGGGMERLTGIVTALGQANAKGKLQTEEILQLVERGVPVWDMLAAVTGKNAEQLQKLATEGRLGRDVIAALIVEMGKSADGEAAKGMARLSGLMSNLKDTATGFFDRIADAGALDFVKGKLKGVSDTISEMESNGSLDRLAKALSNAFVVGASKTEDFIRSLLRMNSVTDITFGEATDTSTRFFENFGAHIDDAALRIKMFIAPFRSLFNGIISAAAVAAGSFTKTWSIFLGGLSIGADEVAGLINTVRSSFANSLIGVIDRLESAAQKIPGILGGDKIRAALADARNEVQSIGDDLAPDNMLYGLRDSLKIASDKLSEFADLSVEVISDAGADISNAWSTTLDYRVEGERRAAAAAAAAAEQTKDAWQQAAEAGMVSNDAMRDSIVQAAIDGTSAIVDMAEALDLIDTANTASQLEGLKTALFRAWQDGRISLEDYQAAHNGVVEKIRETQTEAAALTAGMGKNAEAVSKLKAEQAALLEQYRAGSITLEDYQSKHNAAAESIRSLSAETVGAGGAMGAAADEVRKLKAEQAALLEQYRSGSITLEEYQSKHNAAAEAINRLGQSSGSAAGQISDLGEKFETLADVQQAISDAQTDVEINAIKKALREMFEAGTITGAQYNQELQNVTARQKELKGAVEQTASSGKQAAEQLTKSQQMYNAALEDSILTNEELRRISGARMEEERRASGEAMERQRKGIDTTQRDMTALNDWTSSVLTSAREPLAQMSAAALEAYDNLRGISSVSVGIDTSGLEATRASLQGVADQLDNVKAAEMELLTNGRQNGLSGWMLDVQRASLETQQAYLGQKSSLQSLMERYESGSMSLKSFISAAKGAASGMSLLDDSDLSSLESAIASAEQQMQALGDSTRSSMESLLDELDGLEGRQADIERRKFASRQRDLQAQLAEAQASGDSTAIANASRALGLLRQIEAATAQQRQREEQQKRVDAAGQAAPAAQQPAAPAKIIRLESRGKTVDVPVSSARDETNLLAILEDAGLRTL